MKLQWYKTLSIHQKINLKELCIDITGIHFWFLVWLFGFEKAINLIYEKLKMEGFEV